MAYKHNNPDVYQMFVEISERIGKIEAKVTEMDKYVREEISEIKTRLDRIDEKLMEKVTREEMAKEIEKVGYKVSQLRKQIYATRVISKKEVAKYLSIGLAIGTFLFAPLWGLIIQALSKLLGT